MSRLRSLLPYALSAYTWARKHPRTVLAVASAVLLHGVAVVWSDVPSEAILTALGAVLGA